MTNNHKPKAENLLLKTESRKPIAENYKRKNWSLVKELSKVKS